MRDERKRIGVAAAVGIGILALLYLFWGGGPTGLSDRSLETGADRPVRVESTAGGGARAESVASALRSAASERTEVTRMVTVRVLTGGGEPVAGAKVEVSATAVQEPVGSEALSFVEASTGEGGSCQFVVDVDRAYDVSAFARGYLAVGGTLSKQDADIDLIVVPDAAYGVALIDVEQNREILLSQVDAVELVSPQGTVNLMAGATRRFLAGVERLGLDPYQVALRMARSRLFIDEDGSGRDAELVARLGGYEDVRVPLQARDVQSAFRSPITVLVEPLAGVVAVTFMLRDRLGRVPEGGQYLIVREQGGSDDTAKFFKAVDAGEPCVVRLRPGSYEASYTTGRVDWSSSTAFAVGDGRDAEVSLVQEPTSTLRVRDSSERPMPVFLRRITRLRDNGEQDYELYNLWPTTRRDVVMRGLEPGRYQVEAWFVSGAVTREFTLAPGGVHVVDRNGG